jgi:argininosuccinate lyase
MAGAKSSTYVRAVSVPEARASRFTARYMLLSDLAYVLSAAELGYTPREAAQALAGALLDLLARIEEIDTTAPPGDIVAQREAWVQAKVGARNGAWLHLGRNRGESLRCYLPRLFFRQSLYDQKQALLAMIEALLTRAEPLIEALSPNYHHLQHSGFTTAGEYLLSWATVFERHLERIDQGMSRLDLSPSVFGARDQIRKLYDRVSARLGFATQARLRRDGIWLQAQFTEPFFLHTLVGVDLARLAQDLRIWMTPEFGLFELADEHAGGSSALPHARVPFGLQAVIGTSMMASTRLAGEMTAASGPSEGSEPLYASASLYQAADDLVAATRYMADVIAKGRFNVEEMRRKALFDYAGSSEAHDRLVYDFGVPFRTGHKVLGSLVRAHYESRPFDLRGALEAEMGRTIEVDQQEIADIVLGKRIWPTTFDFGELRVIHADLTRKTRQAREEGSVNPVDTVSQKIIQDAQRFVAAG